MGLPRYLSGSAWTFFRQALQHKKTERVPSVTLMGPPMEERSSPLTGQKFLGGDGRLIGLRHLDGREDHGEILIRLGQHFFSQAVQHKEGGAVVRGEALMGPPIEPRAWPLTLQTFCPAMAFWSACVALENATAGALGASALADGHPTRTAPTRRRTAKLIAVFFTCLRIDPSQLS